MDLREKFKSLVDQHSFSRHEESLAAYKSFKDARADILEATLTPIEMATYYAGMATTKASACQDQAKRLDDLKKKFSRKEHRDMLGELSGSVSEHQKEMEELAGKSIAIAMGMISAECMVQTLKDGGNDSGDEQGRMKRLASALVNGDCDCDNCKLRVKAFEAVMADPDGALRTPYAEGWKKNGVDFFKETEDAE